MKKGKALVILLTLFFVFGIHTRMVRAAGGGEIYLNVKEAGTGTFEASCEIHGVEELTNGKLRIRYASEKLKLEKSEAGSALAGFMSQINDPIQGSKSEGEIVLAFASAQAKKTEGSMLNLTFSRKDGAICTAEDFSVAVEELASGTEKLSVQVTAVRLDQNQNQNQNQEIQVKKVQLADVSIAPIANQTYTGKKIKPALTLTYLQKILEEGKDYQVSYTYNRLVGRATVSIKGTGEYEGFRVVSFYIVPKAPKMKKVKALSGKKILISWKKIKAAAGYQIQISTDKAFTKNVRIIRIKRKSITRKILKVKRKRNYYIRICSYKKIDGGYRYGSYGPKKRVRVR